MLGLLLAGGGALFGFESVGGGGMFERAGGSSTLTGS